MDLLQALVHSLSQYFSMKDMGMPKYFLCIEMEIHSESIFLHQHAYIKKILHVASIADCNPMPTPLPQCWRMGRRSIRELDIKGQAQKRPTSKEEHPRRTQRTGA